MKLLLYVKKHKYGALYFALMKMIPYVYKREGISGPHVSPFQGFRFESSRIHMKGLP
jgi:hypothetical protein